MWATMRSRAGLILGPLLALSLCLGGEARAVGGPEGAEPTVVLRVVPARADGMEFAQRVEVIARSAAPLVRETDTDAGEVLAQMRRVVPLAEGRALISGEAILGDETHTLQVWLVAVRDGRVELLDELSLSVARRAPLGGVVRTRGQVRVMIPAPSQSRAEVEEWELMIHGTEADRERMRFRPLFHSREGVRAGRRIAWVDVDLTRGRFVTHSARAR